MKKCVEMREMLFKNWKLLFENTNQTPPKCLARPHANMYHQKVDNDLGEVGIGDLNIYIYIYMSQHNLKIMED